MWKTLHKLKFVLYSQTWTGYQYYLLVTNGFHFLAHCIVTRVIGKYHSVWQTWRANRWILVLYTLSAYMIAFSLVLHEGISPCEYLWLLQMSVTAEVRVCPCTSLRRNGAPTLPLMSRRDMLCKDLSAVAERRVLPWWVLHQKTLKMLSHMFSVQFFSVM